jgi:histidinol-phosphate/aromatic aminotransferase/cobyric acid decarboxylase-like protein
MPEAVAAAIAAQSASAYADLDPVAAERHLARDAGVPRARVMLTSGATEALRLVMTALVAPGETVMVAGPTYGEYARAAELRGAAVDELRAQPPSFAHRAADILRRARAIRPALLIVCEPNNPTGQSLGRAALSRLADELPSGAHLVVDESFLPFADDRPRGAAGWPRTIAIRSLTKILAAPGVRAGYLVAEPGVLRRLRAVRDPWPVGAHACAAAGAASWCLDGSQRREVARWRTATTELLRRARIEPVPSRANFVLGNAGPRARLLVEALAERRIAVRWCASFGLPEHIRFAVRPPNEQARLAAALREIRG